MQHLTGWRDGIAAMEPGHAIGRSPVQAAQAADIAEWLPNDLLIKLDRCLMAHGVEGRTPFLDPEIARFAFTLPVELPVRLDSGFAPAESDTPLEITAQTTP